MKINDISKDQPNESLDNKGDARRKQTKDAKAHQPHNDWPGGLPTRYALCKQPGDSKCERSQPQKECTTVTVHVRANRMPTEIDRIVSIINSNHDPNKGKEDRAG